MSKLIKKPILLPNNVFLNLTNKNYIVVQGTKGTLKCYLNDNIFNIQVNENKIFISSKYEKKNYSRQIGTIYALIKSAVIGVHKGYKKKLFVFGVGYKFTLNKTNLLQLSLGFSHIINYEIPDSIKATCVSNTELLLEGIDKQLLGQTAADIYFLRPPDDYKGKGIRYENQKLNLRDTKKK